MWINTVVILIHVFSFVLESRLGGDSFIFDHFGRVSSPWNEKNYILHLETVESYFLFMEIDTHSQVLKMGIASCKGTGLRMINYNGMSLIMAGFTETGTILIISVWGTV